MHTKIWIALGTVSAIVLAACAFEAPFPGLPPNIRDPGIRSGASGAGGPLTTLNPTEQAAFSEGQSRFVEVETVPDGLGPRFNGLSCGQCHSTPFVGGSSPVLNPQIATATANGAVNVVPSFLSSAGPVREARFLKKLDGTPDGSVTDLFVITGRADAPAACAIKQPDFATAVKTGNVIFRIPSPTFGDGLIEAISDSTILANKTINASYKTAMGIGGHENRIAGIANLSGNDATITRFGWKAQNKLQIFAGEAYNVEEGVTNELFPNERDDDPRCATNALPEDHTNFDQSGATKVPSDVVMFATFMTMLAPPTPAPLTTPSQTRGQQLFTTVGCSLCHTPSLHTGNSIVTGVSNQDVHLFSDLLVHHMGSGLSDGVTQGGAGPDEFRTAPLWGVGQRAFLLHDGRTGDLAQAIQAHASPGSEANKVVGKFDQLPPADAQAILDYLRTL